ncbi:MAG: extracellular solute-binding protein [SAR86 cluster bacterium]|jgi:iron(III) transport system substrate-binding protein|uniref:Extracellular solute-binding protein n=1 Tax=SAR86 cluster bacterium TaxID=2030880 RepID=A0A520MWB8_9GAMM|nr:MAG: extracellular solute-binding protein [SAR86 cluster bacterium]|tara:strand:+ start:4839 stop:5834 length:996 start_codon:yes stop_codon:yes gene_type:complete
MKKLTIILSIFILVSCSYQANDELTIYTSRQPQLLEPIIEDFFQDTGIKVNLLSGNAQELMERIDIEGEDSPADIFMTVDAGVLWQATERKIFSETNSDILKKNIPEYLRDPSNQWFGFSKRARTIVYSSDKFSDNDFSSYEALSDPKWAGKLCLRTSKKVYNRSLMASMIDAYGYDEAKAVVLGWVSNLATEVFSNDTNALKAVSSGQCGVTIVNTYYLARLLDDPKYDNLSLFWANQGDRGVHVNISGAGVVKTSKNKANAVKLLEYLSSMKAQDFYASANKEYPVLASADIDDSIEGWGEFSEDNINVSKLGSLQKEAVFLAQEAGYK